MTGSVINMRGINVVSIVKVVAGEPRSGRNVMGGWRYVGGGVMASDINRVLIRRRGNQMSGIDSFYVFLKGHQGTR